MRHILAISAAIIAAGLAGSAAAQAGHASDPHASAGLCVLLDGKGQVLAARLAETSGDARIDQDAVELARKLRWAPPYPKAGWLGVRITLGGPPGPASTHAVPHCAASTDSRFDDAI